MPLSSRIKELEYEENPNYRKTLAGHSQIKSEAMSIMENSRQELLVFSFARCC
jgi:hypothetical protein